MGTIYRVTVVAETTDDKGGHEGSETLFELAGGADMVARIAPSALGDALSVDASETSALSERVMDSAAAAGAPVEQRPRRPRRTKAQIAADEAAAAAGVQRVQDGANAAAGYPSAGVTATTTFQGAAPMQQAVGSPAGMSVPPVNTATPPAGDYNPFGA